METLLVTLVGSFLAMFLLLATLLVTAGVIGAVKLILAVIWSFKDGGVYDGDEWP